MNFNFADLRQRHPAQALNGCCSVVAPEPAQFGKGKLRHLWRDFAQEDQGDGMLLRRHALRTAFVARCDVLAAVQWTNNLDRDVGFLTHLANTGGLQRFAMPYTAAGQKVVLPARLNSMQQQHVIAMQDQRAGRHDNDRFSRSFAQSTLQSRLLGLAVQPVHQRRVLNGPVADTSLRQPLMCNAGIFHDLVQVQIVRPQAQVVLVATG